MLRTVVMQEASPQNLVSPLKVSIGGALPLREGILTCGGGMCGFGAPAPPIGQKAEASARKEVPGSGELRSYPARRLRRSSTSSTFIAMSSSSRDNLSQ